MATEACENAVLTYLSTPEGATGGIDDTYPWAEANQLDPLVVIGAVNSLLTEGYVDAHALATSFYTLSAEAEAILQNGSQEIIVLKAITAAGKLTMEALLEAVGQKDVCKIGMANCLKNKWVKKDGADLVPVVKVEDVPDTTQNSLKALADANFAKDAIDEQVCTNTSYNQADCHGPRYPSTYISVSDVRRAFECLTTNSLATRLRLFAFFVFRLVLY